MSKEGCSTSSTSSSISGACLTISERDCKILIPDFEKIEAEYGVSYHYSVSVRYNFEVRGHTKGWKEYFELVVLQFGGAVRLSIQAKTFKRFKEKVAQYIKEI